MWQPIIRSEQNIKTDVVPRAIYVELRGEKLARPMTHDLFCNILAGLRAELESVTIYKLEDEVFFAHLNVKQQSPSGEMEQMLRIDSRPSDGIAIALRRQSPIYAIKPQVSGVITDDPEDGHMAWSVRKFGNYMQTPLIYGDELYCCMDNGILSCYDAKSGEMHYRERLGSGGGGGFSASAVAADGKVYITSEQGEIYVIKAGTTFEVLAINEMGETCMATPAISQGTLFFRTRNHVVAIAESND